MIPAHPSRSRSSGRRAGLIAAAAALITVAVPHVVDVARHDLVAVVAGGLAALGAGLMITRDSAARSAAESERDLLAEAIATLPCHFAVFGRDGMLVACNPAYRALHAHGFASARGPVTYEHLMREAARRTLPAEEVETEAQAFALRREGCAVVQGWLTGAPVPAEALTAEADPQRVRA